MVPGCVAQVGEIEGWYVDGCGIKSPSCIPKVCLKMFGCLDLGGEGGGGSDTHGFRVNGVSAYPCLR